MGELFKIQHTLDEMMERMGVTIVLDGDNLSEEDKREAEKHGDIVKVTKKEEKGEEEA